MNIYNIDDENFKNTEVYKSFMNDNPVNGYLKIRAYSASEAIPVRGLKITVSTEYEGNTIIFFDGVTDTSGVIEKITLPAPKLNSDNMDIPSRTTYDINATYEPNLVDLKYKVNIYEDVFVIQNINIVPDSNSGGL